MNSSLPFFKSHYSIGRSILTLEKPEDRKEDGPDSIIDIAVKNNLEEVFLVDDSMSGLLEGYTNLLDEKIKLVFGLRLEMCPDITEKDEDSILNSSKIVLMARSREGYNSLIKIYSTAAKDGFYYKPRLDFKVLKTLWNKELLMVIPFYDSFLHKNIFSYARCMPDLTFAEPVFAKENSNLPFDSLISSKIEEYTKDKYETLDVRSVYYKDKKDFKAYLTFRCINNRSTLNRPQLDHMSSNEFCFETLKG